MKQIKFLIMCMILAFVSCTKNGSTKEIGNSELNRNAMNQVLNASNL